MVSLKCFSCGTELSFADKVGRREECPKCRSDVHSCRNCQFYDPKVYNECKETQAEVVREKDRSNHCDYFQPGKGQGGVDKTAQLRAAAEALFKKKTD